MLVINLPTEMPQAHESLVKYMFLGFSDRQVELHSKKNLWEVIRRTRCSALKFMIRWLTYNILPFYVLVYFLVMI